MSMWTWFSKKEMRMTGSRKWFLEKETLLGVWGGILEDELKVYTLQDGVDLEGVWNN
jgi:hypothetical protein